MSDLTTYDAQLEKIVLSMKAINIILEGNANNAKSLSKGASEDEKGDEKEIIDELKEKEEEDEIIDEPIVKKGGE